jgi:hypothetical protein
MVVRAGDKEILRVYILRAYGRAGACEELPADRGDNGRNADFRIATLCRTHARACVHRTNETTTRAATVTLNILRFCFINNHLTPLLGLAECMNPHPRVPNQTGRTCLKHLTMRLVIIKVV